MHDEHEKVHVRFRLRREQASGVELASAEHVAPGEEGACRLQHLRLFDQHSPRPRRLVEHRREHGSQTAPDVGYRAIGRPFHVRNTGSGQDLRLPAHKRVERLLLVRVLGQVIPEWRPENLVRRRVPGAQRISESVRDICGPGRGESGPHRIRVVFAQHPAEVGKTDVMSV